MPPPRCAQAMKAAGRIMGRVMKETEGRADGAEVMRMIREQLG